MRQIFSRNEFLFKTIQFFVASFCKKNPSHQEIGLVADSLRLGGAILKVGDEIPLGDEITSYQSYLLAFRLAWKSDRVPFPWFSFNLTSHSVLSRNAFHRSYHSYLRDIWLTWKSDGVPFPWFSFNLASYSVLSRNAVGPVGWSTPARDPTQRQHQVQPKKPMEF